MSAESILLLCDRLQKHTTLTRSGLLPLFRARREYVVELCADMRAARCYLYGYAAMLMHEEAAFADPERERALRREASELWRKSIECRPHIV
jgi:hypothetical protein